MALTSTDRPRVQSLVQRNGLSKAYDAFDVVELTETKAVLTGPLLLEVGEKTKLRVLVASKKIDVDATVVAVQLKESKMVLELLDVPAGSFSADPTPKKS